MREERDAGDVADRPDVLGGAAAVVDVDAALADRHAELLEAETSAFGCRPVATSSRSASTVEPPDSVDRSRLCALDRDAGAHVDALLAEDVADDRARLLVHAAEEARAVLDHRHARAERAKNCASSAPTGPLPITARLSGTSCVEVASMFVQ